LSFGVIWRKIDCEFFKNRSYFSKKLEENVKKRFFPFFHVIKQFVTIDTNSLFKFRVVMVTTKFVTMVIDLKNAIYGRIFLIFDLQLLILRSQLLLRYLEMVKGKYTAVFSLPS